MATKEPLNSHFDSVASEYDAVRPRYPEALFDALVERTGLTKGAKALEIGPGTGQATLPLAKRGFQIVAVELGAALADFCRSNLSKFENVEVLNGGFEKVDLPDDAFDLVYAATSFHWVAPAAKFAKPYRLLRAGGHLALINTHHVSDDKGDLFFHGSQAIYRSHETEKTSAEDLVLPGLGDLEAPGIDERFFVPVSFDLFPVIAPYSAKDYAQLLGTYSPTLAMPVETRRSFLSQIEDLIDKEFDGSIDKHFAMSLLIAKKRD